MMPVQPIELAGAALLCFCGFQAAWLATRIWRNRNGGEVTKALVWALLLLAYEFFNSAAIWVLGWLSGNPITIFVRLVLWPAKLLAAVGVLVFIFYVMPRLGERGDDPD